MKDKLCKLVETLFKELNLDNKHKLTASTSSEIIPDLIVYLVEHEHKSQPRPHLIHIPIKSEKTNLVYVKAVVQFMDFINEEFIDLDYIYDKFITNQNNKKIDEPEEYIISFKENINTITKAETKIIINKENLIKLCEIENRPDLILKLID